MQMVFGSAISSINRIVHCNGCSIYWHSTVIAHILKPEEQAELKLGSVPEPNPERPGLSNNECVKRIYRDCNYPTHFTDEELENVRQFFNYSFTVLADVKPDKPLCPKLHVRHDWKCLSQQQKTRIINVWKRMYERGDVQRLNDIHVKYWPAWHKLNEFNANHRWFPNQFELLMRSIDRETTLPYWHENVYGVQPERSSVWDVLGHSGNYSNGYCVEDGIYNELSLIPCMKRHWSPRNTIYPWFTPEVLSVTLQTSSNYVGYAARTIGAHFPVHLNIGGYEGQYSVPSTAYDALFYMHHSSRQDNILLRWQLQRQEFLTPLSYNSNLKYNLKTGAIERANFQSDYITGGFVTVREMFWMGFGDLCYVPDQMVRPINRMWRQISKSKVMDEIEVLPTAIKRLRALPKWILKKYFPYFLSDNYSILYHMFEEVGNCNMQCLPLPKPVLMNETEIGRRQIEGYAHDNGHDTKVPFLINENYFHQMWRDLNSVGYCSPYVTTY